MVTKANARMETRMEAMEKVKEENPKVVESQLSSIEGMIQRLVAAWEKKSPTTNIHTVDASGGDEGATAHDGNRWRNLEMPIFDGEDAMGWLTKIERYFRLRAVREEDKLEAVMVAMDEEALGWFQWWESWNTNHSWDGFKIVVTQRFQASSLGNPVQSLLALEQEETMQGFICQFEKCVGMVKGLEESFLVEVFLKRFMEEIRTKVGKAS
ncbi:hypothetical protein GmHk_06G015374 [Glycine max]|nr:hypothetical protein GmHk_06G015374 [Glycine max]